VDSAQLLRRARAQLLGQQAPAVLEHGEGLGGPPGGGERAHQLPAQPFPQRVGFQERGKLGGQRVVAAQRQCGVRPVLDHGEAEFAEPRGLARRERRGTDVGERGAAPQVQGDPQLLGGEGVVTGGERPPAVGREALEQVQVGVLGRGGEAVAGGVELDRVRVAQRAPQPGHLRLQRVGGAGGRVRAVQAVDEPRGRDDPAGVDHQHPEQGPQARAAGGDRNSPAGTDLGGPQHAVPHVPIVPRARRRRQGR
jgi:hypothetical protein